MSRDFETWNPEAPDEGRSTDRMPHRLGAADLIAQAERRRARVRRILRRGIIALILIVGIAAIALMIADLWGTWQ